VIQSLLLEARIKVEKERLRKFFLKSAKLLFPELMFIKSMLANKAKKSQGELLRLLNHWRLPMLPWFVLNAKNQPESVISVIKRVKKQEFVENAKH